MPRKALRQAPLSAPKDKTAASRIRRSAGALKDAPMIPHVRNGASKYKPEYCEIVETLGRQGKSRIQCASILNIDRNTLTNWERQYPAFQQAMARAYVHSQHWWEQKAQDSLGRKSFQAQLWRYSVAGRFKEDYAEKPSQGLADALPDFLAAITEAADRRRQKALEGRNGEDAKPIAALDVDLTKQK